MAPLAEATGCSCSDPLENTRKWLGDSQSLGATRRDCTLSESKVRVSHRGSICVVRFPALTLPDEGLVILFVSANLSQGFVLELSRSGQHVQRTRRMSMGTSRVQERPSGICVGIVSRHGL